MACLLYQQISPLHRRGAHVPSSVPVAVYGTVCILMFCDHGTSPVVSRPQCTVRRGLFAFAGMKA